jgi:ATP-binding cassette, subfamily C, bacterial exporter for protease/lipase
VIHFLNPSREIDAALLGYRRVFVSLALFSGVINLLMLAPPIYGLQVFDRVMTSRNELTLVMLTVMVVGIYILNAAIEWVRGRTLIRLSAALDKQLGERLFNAAFQSNLNEMAANPSQVLGDLTTVRQFLTGPGLTALFDAPWLPIYLTFAFIIHPWLGSFAIVGSLILITLAVWNELATRHHLAEANQLSASASSYVNATLQNAEIIHALGMAPPMRSRWELIQHRMLAHQAHASERSLLLTDATRFIRITWMSLSIGLGSYLILSNEITMGAMIAVAFVLSRAMEPVQMAVSSWKQVDNAITSYHRLNALLEAHPAKPNPMLLPAPSGAVVVENLTVIPPGSQTTALQDINFQLAAGEVLAIVGPSASGKSSLVRALIGIWPPSQGTVRLDGAEITHWSRERLGPHLGYLPQDIELFQGSIAENIARFGPVDSEKVIAAARLAGVHDMILQLPEGYDTHLDPRAFRLSGGQKQRLGLARALYDQPSLIALDEPNSNLDESGEQALLACIAAVKASGASVILVTHRTNILATVDKMLLLREGRQHLFGSKDQVLKTLALASAAARNQTEGSSP